MSSMYVLAVRINKKHIKTISWEKNLKNYPKFCKLLENNELDITEIDTKCQIKILDIQFVIGRP